MGYLLAALLGGFLLFNSAATPDRAAHMAQVALQKRYPSSHVAVQIAGKRGQSVLKGRFKRVRVELSDLTLNELPFAPTAGVKQLGRAGQLEVEMRRVNWNGLALSRANFDFRDVEYDFAALKSTSQFRIVRCGPSRMTIQLEASAVRAPFEERLKSIENLSIGFANDQLLLSGQREVLGAKAPVELRARVIGAGNELRLTEPQFRISGAPLPALAASALIKDVNPLYSFDRQGQWPFRVEITGVRAQNNALEVSANLFLKPAP